VTVAAPTIAASHGLSCYTANLACYLAGEWDADAIVARSVRLAVCVVSPSTIAFSHHDPSLDRLPDGTRLRYVGAPSAALALRGVAEEVTAQGRALVVVDSARLPWSPAYGLASAPHWLLVDDHADARWHVVDRFSGLLPDGEQQPYDGWLDEEDLRAAMALPAAWSPLQELRNLLAFGGPVQVPGPVGAVWLRRDGSGGARAAELDGHWLVGDREALPFLAGRLAESGADAAEYLDDLWAAAGHRSFAYRWQLAAGEGDEQRRQALEVALAAWDELPRLLRFAVDSARRRRPRPTLVRAAFEKLLRAEEGLASAAELAADGGGRR
jgi:hypothetical protein